MALKQVLLAFGEGGGGEVFDLEGVVVVVPLAAMEDRFGDFLEGEVVESVGLDAEGSAADEEGAVGADLGGEVFELGAAEVLSGDVDEVALGGMAVLPKEALAGGVVEAFDLADSLGEALGLEVGVDDLVAPLVSLDEGGGQLVVAEAAAALPIDSLGDAAGVFAVDYFLEAGHAMSVAVVAKFDADPAAAHLVGDGGSRAGAEEGVEDKVAGVGGDMEYPCK